MPQFYKVAEANSEEVLRCGQDEGDSPNCVALIRYRQQLQSPAQYSQR
ncbi:hypothetical protein [Rhodopirellula sp. SWK7]|nr:hypothetical protein [Rhodopirellula sp. SWK7]